MDNTKLTSLLIDYEEGNLSDRETIALFQYLIDTGKAWSLQGHYGRVAQCMVDAELCHL